MKNKKYILKIILGTLTLFLFAISIKFAQAGSIDTSVENKVKVCKDVTCTNPTPGIIDFNVSNGSPIVIDNGKGISGKAWGNEIGFITFNYPSGGVYFADAITGLLKGTALYDSGIINFSVTGQKVFIDPKTGEWNGWAWASGPYGGWVKFDCQTGSCVKTTWRGQSQNEASVSPSTTSYISSGFVNLFNGTKKITSDAYDSSAIYLRNVKNSVSEAVSKINGRAFTTSAANLKILYNQMANIDYKILNATGKIMNNAYNYLSLYFLKIQNSILNR